MPAPQATIADDRKSLAAPLATPVRHPLSRSERTALRVTVIATACFGAYGFSTGAPSTTAYLFVVGALGTALLVRRREPLPTPLCAALPVIAIGHLLGGLVRVRGGVLYNASYLHPALRYDHLEHSVAVFVGTFACWYLFSSSLGGAVRARHALVVFVLAGLGLGALNEMIEFLSTLAHSGSHVGGYTNTGWDLVSNLAGAGAAGLCIHRTAR